MTWTVSRVLGWTTEQFQRLGVGQTPRLDAELLVAHVLGVDRVGVYLHHDRPLTEDERTRLRELIKRRSRGEPVAYLLGRREFYGLDLEIDQRVLIPRPDTELLVDEAIELIRRGEARGPVLDLGTGSGAIALALVHEIEGLEVIATDLSKDALAVAGGNAVRLGFASRVHLVRMDCLSAVAPGSLGMLLSNPPYVATSDPELDPAVARFEPGLALFAGSDGLVFFRRLGPEAARVLRPGGWLVVEIGAAQAEGVTGILERAGFSVEMVREDLAGRPRAVIARSSA